ncbi:hypothetical protein TL16_g02918 [Triparma laevis f. inornata]|uniref:N-acetyltransferase domain-containing protein n=2 Tax=Triparma laevis TaxID=1534972 RepID=A0A9W7AV85_9STRA|nr:hypothetical protein TL16_g02918 [Triparma laevis f. inornata]GMH74994.1 hypothetical protein TrLO_g8784 [Triparma laevis f. longispina]
MRILALALVPLLNIFSRFKLPSLPLPSLPQPSLSPPLTSDLDSCADLLIANLSIKSLKRRTSKELQDRYDSINDYMFCSKDPTTGEVIGFVELRVRNFGIKETLNDGSLRFNSGVYEYFPNSPPSSRLSFTLTPVITNLIVNPKYRKTGLGSKLVKCCMMKAKSLKFDTVALQVEKSNLRSIEWYEGLGFEKLYEDKSSRRVEVGVFGERSVRTTKVTMSKSIKW